MSYAKDFYNQPAIAMAISYTHHPAFASSCSPDSSSDITIMPAAQPHQSDSFFATAGSTLTSNAVPAVTYPLPPVSTTSHIRPGTSTDPFLPEYRAPEHRPSPQHIIAAGHNHDLLIRTGTTTQYYLSTSLTTDPPLVLRSGPNTNSGILAALRFGKFPSGTLCLGDPSHTSHPPQPGSSVPPARWGPWERELGFKTMTFTVPGPRGDGKGERRMRWEKSRSRKHGLGTLGLSPKGWLLTNLDTEEVLASFRAAADGARVGEVKWFADVTSDEEVGALVVLVGMWFRMRQLESGGEWEKVAAAVPEERGSGESGRSGRWS